MAGVILIDTEKGTEMSGASSAGQITPPAEVSLRQPREAACRIVTSLEPGT